MEIAERSCLPLLHPELPDFSQKQAAEDEEDVEAIILPASRGSAFTGACVSPDERPGAPPPGTGRGGASCATAAAAASAAFAGVLLLVVAVTVVIRRWGEVQGRVPSGAAWVNLVAPVSSREFERRLRDATVGRPPPEVCRIYRMVTAESYGGTDVDITELRAFYAAAPPREKITMDQAIFSALALGNVPECYLYSSYRKASHVGCYVEFSGTNRRQSPKWCYSLTACQCPEQYPYIGFVNGDTVLQRAEWSCFSAMPKSKTIGCSRVGNWHVGGSPWKSSIYTNPNYQSLNLTTSVTWTVTSTPSRTETSTSTRTSTSTTKSTTTLTTTSTTTLTTKVTTTGIPQSPQCPSPTGLVQRIENSAISSSSQFSEGDAAWASRFEEHGWAATSTDLRPWLQWDFGIPATIVKVKTLGRWCGQWISSYTLEYSDDGIDWTKYPGEFPGNTKWDLLGENKIQPAIQARMLRMYVVKQKQVTWVAARVELVGCL